MATYSINPGSSWNDGNYKDGDVLNFTGGSYGYFSGANLKGVTMNFIAPCTFKNGINLTDSSNITINGGAKKNLIISGNTTGVAIAFKGKCSNIVIDGLKVDNCYSAIWFKTEVGDFTSWNYWVKNTDGTISPSFIMDGFKISNFEFTNLLFDGCYIGSTGQKADRSVTIDGVTYYPLPAKVANIQIENGLIDGSARTGLQCSGVLNGTNFLKNVTIKNSGKSKEQYQGANFLIGGNSPADFLIDNCTFDGANLYNVRTDGGGTITFTNNTVKNACTVGGVQQPTKMAAVQFDGSNINPQTKFIISSNTVDASNNGVSIVVYGDANNVSSYSVLSKNTLAGSFENFSGVTFKDVATTPTPEPEPEPIPATISHFTLLPETKSAVIYKTDGTSELINDVSRVVGAISKKGIASWFYYDLKSIKHNL